MPKNAKNSRKISRPHKEREFEAYIIWKSLPPALRGKPEETLKRFGVDDPLAMEVMTIQNQTDFARKFNIKDLGTLTDWNDRIEKGNLKRNYMQKWAAERLPNALDALYKRIMKYGKGSDLRVFLEYVYDWTPPKKRKEAEGDISKMKRELMDLHTENLRLKLELAKRS